MNTNNVIPFIFVGAFVLFALLVIKDCNDTLHEGMEHHQREMIELNKKIYQHKLNRGN